MVYNPGSRRNCIEREGEQMKEYIEKEAAVNFAQHAYNQWNIAMAAADGQREINLVYKRQELCKAVKSVFSDMPAADVVEVVRCRDCKRCDGFHGDRVEPGEIGICKINQMAVGPDSFCSWGIRRE